jgi:hypothetical protein
MGMFDWVTCKKPLPISEDEEQVLDIEFQTKDLENQLDHYHIDEEGNLSSEYMIYEDGEENGTPTRTGKLFPYLFSGFMGFYGDDPDPTKTKLIHFEAEFFAGKCKSIRRLE